MQFLSATADVFRIYALLRSDRDNDIKKLYKKLMKQARTDADFKERNNTERETI